MVVVKQSVQFSPKASKKKLKFFDDLLYYEYRFHCFFTKHTLPAQEIREHYKPKAEAGKTRHQNNPEDVRSVKRKIVVRWTI